MASPAHRARVVKAMEIEAKFQVPDDDTLDRLAALDGLAGFALGQARPQLHEDTYLDSPTGLLLQAGYTCRLRRRPTGGTLITVKGLAGAGEVMRREELEVVIEDGVLHPAGWPESPARELVLAIVGLESLLPLLALRQERVLRDVSTADGVIAEMSGDRVEVEGGSGGPSGCFLELEIELKGDGTEADLAALGAVLRDEWGLSSERRSKFERALVVVEEGTRKAALGGYTRGTGGRPGGRGLLTPDELAASIHIAEQNDVYGRRARALVALHEGATQEEAGALAGFSSRRTRYWLAEFRRDRLGIFPSDLLEETVGTAPVAVEEAPDEPATAPEEALDEDAAFVMPPLEDPADVDLVTEDAAEPDVAAAGVTAATITVVEPPPAERGEAATEGANGAKAAAQKKPKAVRPGVLADDTMAEAADKILLFQLRRMIEHEPGTRKGEDIEELHDMRVATRRMRAALRLFEAFVDPVALRPFLKTLRRTGRTLGAVRDLDVFWEKTEHYLEGLPPERQGELEPLRRVWESERDQARGHLIGYLDGQRYGAFKEEFEDFLLTPGAAALPALLPDGAVRPARVRDVLPQVIYVHAAEVWAFDEWLRVPEVPLTRFHRLRIAAKGLRYTLEFFSEVLDSGGKEVIAPIKRLQDHLGDLNDAVVTCGVLRDFLTWGTWGRPEVKDVYRHPEMVVVAPGVAAYLAARQEELGNLVITFPEVWPEVVGPGCRHRVAGLCADL